MIRLTSILILLFFVTSSFTSEGGQSQVYICKGPASKKYHLNKHCRGLSNCSTDIYKVSIQQARNMGRGLCGWEK